MVRDYVVFDTETTGLSPDKDKIIEIGALKVRGGKVIDRFSAFIDPHEPLSPLISHLTGITDEMLENAGEAEDVIAAFCRFSEGYVIIGHNLMFDFKMVRNTADRYGLSFDRYGIDTLAIARKVHKDMESRSLEALCAHYNVVNASAHRAYHDALATAKVYQSMAHYYEAGHPELFQAKKLDFKRKKQRPMTKKQKAYLIALCKYHKIDFNESLEQMTMSEASRFIDQTISKYGRM